MNSLSFGRKVAVVASACSEFPISLFGAVMGVSGLANAWRLGQPFSMLSAWMSAGFGYIAVTLFGGMTLALLAKAWRSFSTVRAEFMHPVNGPLYGTPLVSMVLIPPYIVETNVRFAQFIWMTGAVGATFFAVLMVRRWLTLRHKLSDVSPTWIIPVVGVINIPLALPVLQLNITPALMMYELSTGLFFALPLLTLIIARMMFSEPVSEPLQPSVMILVAPFAVGFSSYILTIGHMDAFAEALFMIMTFFLVVLSGHLIRIVFCHPFRLSLWTVSFPLAASSSASIRYALIVDSSAAAWFAISLLLITSAIIMALLLRTSAKFIAWFSTTLGRTAAGESGAKPSPER